MDRILSERAPAVPFHRLSWRTSRILLPRLGLATLLRIPLTVHDAFGTPGDTVSTATVCRQIKERYPKLRINVITPNPELLRYDPAIDVINAPPTLLRLTFWYLDLVNQRASKGNILGATARELGFDELDYKAKVYLTAEEESWARAQLESLPRPLFSINAMSREMVKVWPLPHWKALVAQLHEIGTVVQVGDDREPSLDGVVRFAGKLTMRQSMAILSQMSVHIGPDSFLMHAANGLDVASVAIFGGSRPVACLGYDGNENLETQIECGPCWIHTSHGQTCQNAVKCMEMIAPRTVYAAVTRLLTKSQATKAYSCSE